MDNIQRIYPESRTGLINWIEQNFHDIDEHIVMFHMKDGTSMFIYDTYTYRGALGSLEIAKETLFDLAQKGEFTPKRKEGD